MFIGFAADIIGPVNAYVFSSQNALVTNAKADSLFFTFFLGGILQLVFWPFAKSFGQIIVFSIVCT